MNSELSVLLELPVFVLQLLTQIPQSMQMLDTRIDQTLDTAGKDLLFGSQFGFLRKD